MLKIIAVGFLISVSALASSREPPQPGFVITPNGTSSDGSNKFIISFYDLKEYSSGYHLTFSDNAGTFDERMNRAILRAKKLSPQLAARLTNERKDSLKRDPDFENYRIGFAAICETYYPTLKENQIVVQAISYLPQQVDTYSDTLVNWCGEKTLFQPSHLLRSEKYPDVSAIVDVTDPVSTLDKVAYEVHRLLEGMLAKSIPIVSPAEIRYLTAWILSDADNDISRFSKNLHIQYLLYLNRMGDEPKGL